MKTTTLDTLGIGRTGRVSDICRMADCTTQLLEMGLTPGAEISVARVAPLGDPIEVVVRGYHLSLRRREAKHVSVMPMGHTDQSR